MSSPYDYKKEITEWVAMHTRPCVGVSGCVKMNEEHLVGLLKLYFQLQEMLDDLKKVGDHGSLAG